jgi:hypothetical protein
LVPCVLAAHIRHIIEQEWTMTELGMFLPVGKNGYIVSAAAPQYHPSYAMLKVMTRLVEDLGFSFVLSPVKYRGWGGPTEFADYVLESFEVMAALAEATDRIRLYGYVARLRQMCEDAERLLEARHGLAIGRPRHGLVLHLPAVRQGLVPHLAPQGMMG